MILTEFVLKQATRADVPLILQLIRELAVYHDKIEEVTATEAMLEKSLFGDRPFAQVVICYEGTRPNRSAHRSALTSSGSNVGAAPSSSTNSPNMQTAHAALIHELIRGSVSHEHQTTTSSTSSSSSSAISRATVQNKHDSLIPVGFALFYPSYSTFLGKPGIHLEDLYVREEFRGKGYGKKMLIFLANLSKEMDCGRLEWACAKFNAGGIKFYESLGAVAMDEWITYRLCDDTLSDLASA